MLPFIRTDLAQFTAYGSHSASTHTAAASPDYPDRPDRLDTNESPFDLPDELKQKLTWQYQQDIQANRYPDGAYKALKQAIAAYVTESAVTESAITESASKALAFSPAHISIGNGSDELIRSLLIATCLGGAGRVLVADPTFSMYKILAQTLGIPVVTVPRQPETFEIDIDAAQSAIAAPGDPPVRLVFMVHPNSPTGNALTTNELAWLRTLPPDVLVVIDEAYFEFSQQTTVATVLEQPNWIVTRTFSKAFSLAAHRVGYAIAQPDAIAVLEKVRLPYNLPSFSQAAALIALYHRQTLLQRVPGLLAERDRLFDALQTHPNFQVWPSAANFIYGRVAPLADATDSNLSQLLFQQLKAQGTLIRYTGGGLRITVGTPEENTRTCDRLLSCLNHLA